MKKEPTAPAPVAGVPVTMGGHEYTVPALTLFSVRQFGARLRKLDMSGQIDDESLDLISEVAHAALKRNYPEITLDDVQQALDLANLMPVYQAVMGVSGFVQGQPGTGGPTPGESTGRS